MMIKFKDSNMDLVMYIARKHKKKLVDVVDFILDNPEIIEITRGELNGEKGQKFTQN